MSEFGYGNSTMTSIIDLQERARQAIETTFQTAERVFGRQFQRCTVSFDIRNGASRGGDASFAKRRIRINRQLLAQNPTEVIEQTCPHEVAHIVAYDLYGQRAWNHGLLWQNVMRKLGKNPDRCHELITPNLLRKAIYECNYCGKQGPVSIRIHNRVQSKLATLKRCRCGGVWTFIGSGHQVIKENKLTCRKSAEQGSLANK